jgi:type I restriction enzyme, S subunit
MKHSWREYKIGDFLERQYDGVFIDDLLKYKRITIRTRGQGIELRDEISGAEIGTKNQFRAKTDQFLLSKIDAMNGAFGIVPKECNGGIITGNFWTYNINEELIRKEYLQLLCIKQTFTEFSLAASEGTTNRKYLREDKFLNLSIPLPPLSEQQLIVSKIEGVKTKLDQIKELRAEQENDIAILRNSLFIELQKKFENVPISQVLVANRNVVKLNPDENYKQVTVKMEHKGVKLRGYIKGSNIGSIQFLANENNFIISKIDARNGAMGMIPADLDGGVVTNDFPLFSFEKNVDPKFFYYFSNTNYFDDACKKASEGTTNRKRLKMNRFLDILIPLPNIEEQVNIVKLLERINDIMQIHIHQEQELTELMPSLLDKAFKGELTYAEQEECLPIAAEPTLNYFAFKKSNIPENKKSFAKQVLGGKIVSLFCNDKNFTHIKFQKLQYMAEHVIEEDLHWNYYRQSAGPYDNKFMHSVIFNLSRNKWFAEKDYKFYPLEKAIEIDNYYQSYFGNKSDKLNKLFCLLKNASEKFCEAVATIYAVWNNHIIQSQQFDKEKIKTDFFAWSNRKENIFTDDEFEKALLWMQKNSIEPTGFGQLIKERK